MAGSIPLSLQQVFDDEGDLLSGGLVYFIQAGTVGTPQNAFQDSGLTIPWANPYTLPENARLPLVYFADGYIKVRITDADSVQVFNQDNIPVTGFATGGGGGGTIDATTVLQTGQIIPMYGTGAISGFVRANGRTMGNASSGATERANADTSGLFAFLYNADANLTVSGGRGANAAADYAANKTITLPDWRGRAIAGLDDMGNSAAGRLTATYFGTAATALGAAGGSEFRTLLASHIPSLTSVNASQAISVVSTIATIPRTSNIFDMANTGSSGIRVLANDAAIGTVTSTGNNSISVTYTNGSQLGLSDVPPTMLATIYLKL